jgi:hypothetical protein
MHTHAHAQASRPAPGRKAIKQLTERLRRDQREYQQELQARVLREAFPQNDEGPPPRID